MKKRTTMILALTAALAFGHEGIEIGPHKGRILEFSKDETMHGEVTNKDGKLHIALLDKDMAPVKVQAQSLSVTSGTREKPATLEVIKAEDGFTMPAPAPDQWLIVQYKESDKAKPVIARMKFDPKTCTPCQSPEWRCQCKKE